MKQVRNEKTFPNNTALYIKQTINHSNYRIWRWVVQGLQSFPID